MRSQRDQFIEWKPMSDCGTDKTLEPLAHRPHLETMSRTALLKNIPPLLGIVALIGGAILLRRWFFLAIPLGLGVWWGSHVLLSRIFGDGRLVARRKRVRQIPDARTRQDMQQALAKIETLKSLNAQIPDESITAALNKLADQAAFLVDESTRHPGRANIAHKALALYLGDAVEVSQGFADLQRFKAMPKAEIEKTAKSLEHLVTLFQTYAERMRKSESVELDIKITVLEDRLRGEGIFDR